MSRLHKKCFAVSMGMHLLLLAVLVLGTAFLSVRSKQQRPQPLNFVSSQMVENALNPTPPQVRPPVVTPRKKVHPPRRTNVRKVVPQPSPKKATPKKATPKKAPSKKSNPKKIRIDLTKTVTRNVGGKPQPKVTTNPRPTVNIAESLSNIRQKMSPAMKIKSIGTASVVFDKYKIYVRNAYYNAWLVPVELTGVVRSVEVRVTIGRDGRVISARITRRAANVKLDTSVQRALDRVKNIGHRFPADAREKQRTFIIDFDLRARRGIG